MRTNTNQGFTLIELMIVIAIIAILMAYALPAYRNYTAKAKIAEGSAMAAAYKMAINEAYTRTGTLNGLDNDTNGIGSLNAKGNCVSTIQVINGEITVNYDCAAGNNGVADPEVDVAILVFSPIEDVSGTLQWECNATVNRPDQDPCV